MTTPCYSRHFRQRSSLSRQSHYHSAKNGKVASVPAHPPSSKPIPIPLPSTHIPRTKSELQFCEDTAAAEWRDLCMFHRLVSGIRERQHRQLAIQRQHDIAEQEKVRGGVFKLNLTSSSRSPVLQTERCIDNIIWTRHNRAPEPVVETQLVTPYESPRDMMQSEEPATISTSDCRQPMHLKSVLRQASDIAQETVEDWSLEGYDNTPTPSLPSYANLPARVEADQDEDDEEIFSLDL